MRTVRILLIGDESVPHINWINAIETGIYNSERVNIPQLDTVLKLPFNIGTITFEITILTRISLLKPSPIFYDACFYVYNDLDFISRHNTNLWLHTVDKRLNVGFTLIITNGKNPSQYAKYRSIPTIALDLATKSTEPFEILVATCIDANARLL